MLIIHSKPKEQSAKNGNGNTGHKQGHSNFNTIKTDAKIFQVFLVEIKGGFILKINYVFASLNEKGTKSQCLSFLCAFLVKGILLFFKKKYISQSN